MKTFYKGAKNFAEELELLKAENFIVREAQIGLDDVRLIYPAHMGCEWNEQNVIFRSSLWTFPDKIPVSLSYKKFVNWGETPSVFPLPMSLKNSTIVEKVDGSCLMVSKFRGTLITRTRGTLDAHTLLNGEEIDELILKYPAVFNNPLLNTEDFTFIFEWVSPVNRIVLDYGPEPDIYLTGIVDHKSYIYLSQDKLDEIAKMWGVKRPPTYKFDDINTLIETIYQWKDKEGICFYHNNGQSIHKIKSTDYLTKHAFKSNLNLETVIDMFIKWEYPEFDKFMEMISKHFDYECSQLALGFVSKVCGAYREMQKIVAHMAVFTIPLKSVPRKDAALKIQQAYGATERSGLAFRVLDGKAVDEKMVKRMIFQLLKK